MGVNNYNIDFRTFRNNFQNISNHIPSDICKDMFLQINIKLILSSIKKEQFFACLFNKNNIWLFIFKVFELFLNEKGKK